MNEGRPGGRSAPLVQKTEDETNVLLKRITSLAESDGHVIRDIQKEGA